MLTSVSNKLMPVLNVIVDCELSEQSMSIEQIASEAGYSPRNTQRHIHTLENLGFIKVKRLDGRGKLPRYNVEWGKISSDHLFTVSKRSSGS